RAATGPVRVRGREPPRGRARPDTHDAAASSPFTSRGDEAAVLSGSDDDLPVAHLGDGSRVVPERVEHLVGVLTEQRGARDTGLEPGELDRAAHGQVRPATLLLDLHDGPALAQRGVLGDLLHAQHRRAGHLPLAPDVDRLVLRLVAEPLLDLFEDLEDAG